MNSTLTTLAEEAARQLARPEAWFGLSGHRLTGEDVAFHIEAAGRLMERETWDPQLYAPFSGHHLRDALDSTVNDGMGDADTRYVARTVLETLLRLVTGAPYVDYEVWSEHSSRTLEEVLTLCRTAARVARHIGPQKPITPNLPTLP
ncbi:hypothetical protein E6R60_33220 [Streptomyces sp. A0642]|uniref:DUF6197 family protein n=1 Tax=Streptomyces sp. A0642 TaxID=2563100 RepID=UPI0010A2A012|nr:hypothetical protein [Streptomyces sp. A0642]THA65379.1 hypothetical protein E6R60_33220 [Streptomyces sp. A0642]